MHTGQHYGPLVIVANHTDIDRCFPTGRHYPGIADLIADANQRVEGLSHAFSASDSWRSVPLVVIDFETTGTNPEEDRVIEIGVVRYSDGKIQAREGLLIDPTVPIPEESRAVHGITDEELAGAPTFAKVVPKILELLQGHLPIAYNANFDRRFLHAELRRAGVDLEAEAHTLPPAANPEVVWLDPLVWAREIFVDLKSRRLGDIAKHLGVPLEQAHRATGDAEATLGVLLKLSDKMPAAYGEVIRIQKRYAAFQEAAFAAWKRNR
ncbi:MAG: 3'-5' exonuclease [Polyangiales bacterium]